MGASPFAWSLLTHTLPSGGLAPDVSSESTGPKRGSMRRKLVQPILTGRIESVFPVTKRGGWAVMVGNEVQCLHRNVKRAEGCAESPCQQRYRFNVLKQKGRGA